MWTVTYEAEAAKSLMAMDRAMARRIRNKINKVAANPHAPNNNALRLQGVEGYRLRVGDWRVVYRLVNQAMVVVVVRIGNRKEVYR